MEERNRCAKEDIVGIVQLLVVLIMIRACERVAYIPKEQRSGVLYCSVCPNRKVGAKFKLDGVQSKFSSIATNISVVHFKTDLHNKMPIISPVSNVDATM